jgi:hypothetical protein
MAVLQRATTKGRRLFASIWLPAGDTEAEMVYHHPLLNEVMELAEQAYDAAVNFADW